MTQYEAVRIDFLDGTTETYRPYIAGHLIAVRENDCDYILMTPGREWVIPRQVVKALTFELPLSPGELVELKETLQRQRRSWSEVAADFVKEQTGV